MSAPDGLQPTARPDAAEPDRGRPEPPRFRERRSVMRVSVDLARCQSYGQCVFFAPEVFDLRDGETLEFDSAPDPRSWAALVRARAACPVQAITYGPLAGPPAGHVGDGGAGPC